MIFSVRNLASSDLKRVTKKEKRKKRTSLTYMIHALIFLPLEKISYRQSSYICRNYFYENIYHNSKYNNCIILRIYGMTFCSLSTTGPVNGVP